MDNDFNDNSSEKVNIDSLSGHNGDPEEREHPQNFIGSLRAWLYHNNPFYLLSVLFLFWGLYLVSVDSQGRGPDSLGNLVLFYGVQNVYEIIMLGMGLYLLSKKINRFHGQLLLFFILLFLCETTMYQQVIASVCRPDTWWVSAAVSSVYLILAVFKLGAAVYVLKIKPDFYTISYAMLAFGLIYFVPQYVSGSLAAAAANSKKYEIIYFGRWELYYIWLVAAVIQLPIIFRYWRTDPNEESKTENEFIGGENTFYFLLALMPFIALPIQVLLNVHPDIRSMNPDLGGVEYCLAPYLFFGAFFVESFFKGVIHREIGLDIYDFVVSAVVLLIVGISAPEATWKFGQTALYPHRINLVLIFVFNVFIILTRSNYLCLGLIIAGGTYFTRNITRHLFSDAIEIFKTADTMARAVVLIISSFFFLAVGFIVSISGNKDKKQDAKK